MAGFFAGLAAPTGLVLVLDDAQWADPASLALLAHLARETPDARLLVAVTYRAAEMAVRSGAVAGLARLPGVVCPARPVRCSTSPRLSATSPTSRWWAGWPVPPRVTCWACCGRPSTTGCWSVRPAKLGFSGCSQIAAWMARRGQ